MNSYNKLNITFSVARVFAVISIISAHITTFEPYWSNKMIKAIGSIGVIVFIILSGYFYKTEKYKNIFSMLKEKARTIGLPWFAMGTLCFLAGGIVTNTLNFKTYIPYMLGYNSFLYYLTVLIICYVLFYKKNKIVLYTSMAVNLVSVYLTAFGLLDGFIEKIYITNYLNVFNWFGYFAIGVLLKELNAERIYTFLVKSKWIFVSVFLVFYIIICVFDVKTGYFSFVGMPFQLIGAVAIGGISTLEILDNKLFHTVSNMTFGVYLVHMPLIGLFDVVYEMNLITKLLAPIIILLFTIVALYLCYLAAKLVRSDKLYVLLTGIRMNRSINK